jgi:hypothetical protein
MNNPKTAQNFMPNFPIKSQKVRKPMKSKPCQNKALKLTKKLCEELSFMSSPDSSKSKIMTFRNQTNYCEIRSLIMTPIRLKKLEISLPELSVFPSPMFPSRRVGTASVRRKSIDSKNFLTSSIEVPAEIITTKYNTRFNSAKPFGARKSEEFIRRSQKYQLPRNRTGDESYNKKWTVFEKDRETESISPTNYSPVYTNNYDV